MNEAMTDHNQEATVLPGEPGGAGEVSGLNEGAALAPQRELTPRQSGKAEGSGPDLDFILDLPVEVSVELGRASMLVGQLLQLSQGSVVELSKLAGEPLEVLVNQKLVARGEAVVVNEKFGVRITDVVPADERVRKLG
jgi:flagellar motor switch protein FliN/FliY